MTVGLSYGKGIFFQFIVGNICVLSCFKFCHVFLFCFDVLSCCCRRPLAALLCCLSNYSPKLCSQLMLPTYAPNLCSQLMLLNFYNS